MISYTCFTQSYLWRFFKTHMLRQNLKPTESESLIWGLEIDIHEKFHRDVAAHLVLRITDLKYDWIPQFWVLFVPYFGGECSDFVSHGSFVAVTSTLATHWICLGELLKTTIAGCTRIKWKRISGVRSRHGYFLKFHVVAMCTQNWEPRF